MTPLPPLTLGPLMLPPGLWLSLLALTAASLVWRRLLPAGATAVPRDDTPLMLAGLGMFGARVGFVSWYWREYLDSPWGILNIRDGGWWWPAGIAAILLGAAVIGWRRQPLRRPLLWSSTAATVVSALAVALVGAWSAAPDQRLPDLPVQNLAGESLPLHDGRPSVINLWATWCPPCRREMPVLVAGAQRYPQIRFLLVNQGEDPETVAAAAQQWSIPSELVGLDATSAVGHALGVRGYPTTLVVAADGRVLQRHSGEVSAASLAALIEQVRIEDRTELTR